MNKTILFLLSILLSQASNAAAVYDGKPLPDDANERCKIGATKMITMRENSLEHIKREERKQETKNKIEAWKKRMATDEDPCLIYKDVFDDAFTS